MRKTKHTVLYTITKQDVMEAYEEDIDVEETIYTLAECDGCEYITMKTFWSINGQGDTVDQYPPALARRRPPWMLELFMADFSGAQNKYKLLQELYTGIGAQNWWLTMLGVRSLLEFVMVEKVGDNGSFVRNLEKFLEGGFISKIQLNALGPLIEAGHATTHRGYQPTSADVNVVMDILENVLESIYVTTARAKKLKVPPRKPAAKAAKNS
ncbi:DUF4145 domain-containing protein [Paracidovorax oryzae]|uniref:DUF4145 domain-containing protein n=1 Tax=Paracidovorax oryzae TaxID=862720 RepID=UPI0005557EAB|nr:DUF4145 domain-containing protein [Paracidovorax oryzae]